MQMWKQQKKPIDKIFVLCVEILQYGAVKFNTTYNAINVWIFVVIWPVITVLLIGFTANCLLNH